MDQLFQGGNLVQGGKHRITRFDDTTVKCSIPFEVVMEILIWLPVKSLMRFRCVNKTWLQLLTTDPHFAKLYIQRHLKKSNKNSSILALQRETHQDNTHIYSAVQLTNDRAVKLELPFCRGSTNSYEVYGICKGLIFVCLAYQKEKLFLWNPFTNDYIHMPSPPILTGHSKRCDKITSFGFGFLQDSNQYKAVCFNECDYAVVQIKSHVSVYTLGTDSSWRNLRDIWYHHFMMDCAAPLVNGALHWLADTGTLSPVSERIVSFDIKYEDFQEIPHPKYASLNYNANNYLRLGELGGLLCILGRDPEENVQVWVMQKYGVANSWTKRFTIERLQVCQTFTSFRPIGVAHNGKIMLKKIAGEFILYNPENNSVTNLIKFGFHFYAACTYTPSLISPRVISGYGLVGTSCNRGN